MDSPTPISAWSGHSKSGRQVVAVSGPSALRKNQQLLIEALSEIPEFRWPFCGWRGSKRTMTLLPAVGDSVRFCGHKADARRFLRESDRRCCRRSGKDFADGVEVPATAPTS